MNYAEVAQTLKKIRKEKQMTQMELAQSVGISRATLSAFESGKAPEIGLQKFLAILLSLGYELQFKEISTFPSFEELLDEQT